MASGRVDTQTDVAWKNKTEEEIVSHLATYGQARRGNVDSPGYHIGWIDVLRHLLGKDSYANKRGSLERLLTLIDRARGDKIPMWAEAWTTSSYKQEVIDHIAIHMNMNDEELYANTIRTLGNDTELDSADDVYWLKSCIQRSSIAWSQETKFFCHLLCAQTHENGTWLRLEFGRISEMMLQVVPPEVKGHQFINAAAVRHCVMTLITSLPVSQFNKPQSLRWYNREPEGEAPLVAQILADFERVYHLSEESEQDVLLWMEQLGY